MTQKQEDMLYNLINYLVSRVEVVSTIASDRRRKEFVDDTKEHVREVMPLLFNDRPLPPALIEGDDRDDVVPK